jgi:hypothetical protein
MSDELRTLTARLLAHLERDDGWRLEPGTWVLGDWTFTPAARKPVQAAGQRAQVS